MAKSSREIDKEIMFSKIMPSSLIAPELADNAEEPGLPSPAPTSPAPNPSQSVLNRASAAAQTASVGVAIAKKDEQVLVNIMEYLVVEKLDAAFAKFNCCKCDKCRKDVAAIALNKLEPKYVVADPDQIPMLTTLQSSSEVTTAIIQGILQVRSKPRH